MLAMTMSTGIMTSTAASRGRTRIFAGGMFMVVRASISWYTFIEASSAVIAEPTRPASSTAVIIGPELAGHRQADEAADVLLGAEIRHGVARLERKDRADEEAQDGDDRERRVADHVALLDEAGPLAGQRAGVGQRPEEELDHASDPLED